MGSSIGDDLHVKTEAKEYFVEEEGGDSLGCNSFLCRAENHPLTKAVVHHDQERVKASGGGKVGDKVTRNLMEGKRRGGGDGCGRRSSGMCVRFVLLTSCTASNRGMNIGSEAWPPELGGDQLASFEKAGVASSGVVVTAAENVAAEIISGRDKDMAFIGEDAISILPVREAGTEGRGNGAIHELKGLEDEGVRGQRGSDAGGES